MFVHPPNLSNKVHVALVTGPAQVWFAAAAASAAGVTADRILFQADNPKTRLMPAIIRAVQALGGVMWTEENALSWFVRQRSSRVLWVNKTNAPYALSMARLTRPGTVVQYADGFVAPLLAVLGLSHWGNLDAEAMRSETLTAFTPNYLALSNVFGNFSSVPQSAEMPTYEVPVAVSKTALTKIRNFPSGLDALTQPVRMLLSTTVHSMRYQLLHGKAAPGIGDDGAVDGEMSLYQTLLEQLPPLEGRVLSIHPRTAPDRRKILTDVALREGWHVLGNETLAEEVLADPDAIVVSPSSSVLFTSSRLCGARPYLVGPDLLDAHLGKWWRETDLGTREVDLCKSAGIADLGLELALEQSFA